LPGSVQLNKRVIIAKNPLLGTRVKKKKGKIENQELREEGVKDNHSKNSCPYLKFVFSLGSTLLWKR
jgi:hypothetical protein